MWFHGTHTNVSRLQARFDSHVRRRLLLENLGLDNLTPAEYSALLLTTTFWERIPTNNVLIFQTDSGFFSQSPHSITDFLAYEYVGSPWPISNHTRMGNGGFSFRHRDAMIRVLTKNPPQQKEVEDVYFASQITKGHLYGAPVSVGFRFAVELTTEYPYPMAFHKPWDHKYARFQHTDYNREAWEVFCRQKVFNW